MRSTFYLFIIYFLIAGCRNDKASGTLPDEKKVHTLESELNLLFNISSLPEFVNNSYCAQISSWDTTGKNDDGFSGTYSFLRKNEDGSLVIFDVSGKGVINRIWTPTPNNDTLDFFIDNNFKPAFSIAFIDLFSGKISPFIQPLCGNQLGGYYCYLPILFEKSCRIITRGKKIQFHQIQYRLYNDEADVVSFKPEINQSEKKALVQIATLWNKNSRIIQDFYQGKIESKTGEFVIEPGKSSKVFEASSGGRIIGIEISPADAFEGLVKNTDIKITWDNELNPAVYCPVADFFGYAYGSTSMKSLLLGSSDNKVYCYFPMPFDKSATIELIGRNDYSGSKLPVKVKVAIWNSPVKRNPESEGKFYAYWNKDSRVQPGVPHLFADIKGKGHYVGTLLQAQGLKAGMTLFFEGDDSTSVDGTFRMHGTGSEDYFNGGWYAMMDRWDERMSLPLHGSLDYSLPFCRTGGYRLFITDKISFNKSLYHSIEHGPVGNVFPADYTSVGLYYSDTPAEERTAPNPELSRVFIPDTLILYPQLLDLTLYGSMDVKTTWKYGTGGESYRFSPGSDSWIRISLNEIPYGNYKMFFDIMMEPDGCEFTVWHRQTQLTDWKSSFSVKEKRNINMFICDLNVDELRNTITTRFRIDPTKNSLLLNRIILIRKSS
jgi:hypothetical protein